MPYIGKEPTIGEFVELDALTASATADYALTRSGAAYYPETVNNLLVSINGVIQAGSTMSLSGNTLTVGATLSSSDVIDFVRVFGNVGNVVTPTDGSVTSAKLDTNIAISGNLDVGTIRSTNGTTAATIDSSGNVTFSGTTNAGPSDSGWITPTLNTGYASYPGTEYAPIQYRKIGNVVNISGLLNTSPHGTVFTLPVGYRPPIRLICPAMSDNGIGRMDIIADGDVTIQNSQNQSTWFSLFVTFMTA